MSQENGKKINPFHPEGIEYEINGQKLTLSPITIKNLKKIISLGNKTLSDFSNLSGSTGIEDIADIVSVKYCEIMRVLFPDPPYKFMTKDFIEENVTFPMARTIIESAIKQNGLADIFPFLKSMASKGSLTSTEKVGA